MCISAAEIPNTNGYNEERARKRKHSHNRLQIFDRADPRTALMCIVLECGSLRLVFERAIPVALLRDERLGKTVALHCFGSSQHRTNSRPAVNCLFDTEASRMEFLHVALVMCPI
jgi:hypothetical protein